VSRRPELIRLAFVSVASDGVGQDDLAAIATVSRIRNRRAGLTGFLIHQGGRFHGVLEGPQRALFARMEAIVTDSRHHKLMVVREDEIASRRFQNWSVGFLPDSSEFTADDASVEFLRSLTRRM
jgi:hypothetical protein